MFIIGFTHVYLCCIFATFCRAMEKWKKQANKVFRATQQQASLIKLMAPLFAREKCRNDRCSQPLVWTGLDWTGWGKSSLCYGWKCLWKWRWSLGNGKWGELTELPLVRGRGACWERKAAKRLKVVESFLNSFASPKAPPKLWVPVAV